MQEVKNIDQVQLSFNSYQVYKVFVDVTLYLNIIISRVCDILNFRNKNWYYVQSRDSARFWGAHNYRAFESNSNIYSDFPAFCKYSHSKIVSMIEITSQYNSGPKLRIAVDPEHAKLFLDKLYGEGPYTLQAATILLIKLPKNFNSHINANDMVSILSKNLLENVLSVEQGPNPLTILSVILASLRFLIEEDLI